MENCIAFKGTTIDAILSWAQIECEHEKGNETSRDKSTKALCKILKKNFDIFKNIEMPEDGEERYQWLCQKICYMFR